jgi:transketolase
MRNAFADEITRLADEMPELALLSGDIGNRLFNTFKERHPARFLNCGVAEANMTGVAAGMALAGLRPVTYTIASFNTGRCLEQIRLDLCYHNLPVVVAGVGAGLSYAGLGPTHHALEDIGWLSSLPNMTVLCPADAVETRLALRAALRHDGPVYLRLGKKNEPVIHATPPDFRIGKGIVLREGSDVCLLGVGTITSVALDAANILAEQGISAKVVSLHTVKPLDTKLLDESFRRFSLVAVIEEHGPNGGAWSAVAQWRAEAETATARMLRCGTPDAFLHEAGGQGWVRERLGLTAQAIAGRVAKSLAKGDGA